jgi:hypothetical protein
METNHEPLHLDKSSFIHWKIMGTPASFILNIIFFGAAFKYGGGWKFWGYVVINTKPLCVELCNLVQFHTSKLFILSLLN